MICICTSEDPRCACTSKPLPSIPALIPIPDDLCILWVPFHANSMRQRQTGSQTRKCDPLQHLSARPCTDFLPQRGRLAASGAPPSLCINQPSRMGPVTPPQCLSRFNLSATAKLPCN